VLALAIAPASAPTPAGANDSMASLASGGLVLEKTDAVALEDEALYVSAETVEVTYRFRNITQAPVTLTVAFPMPEIDVYDGYYDGGAVVSEDPVNFLDFQVWADGRPVASRAIQTAHTPNGRDVTDALRRLGVPLLPFDGRLWEVIEGASPDLRAVLEGMGALRDSIPSWTVRTAFVWEQTFPVGMPVTVFHTYTPAIGGFFLMPTQQGTENDWFRQQFCAGDYEWSGIVRRAGTGEYPTVSVREVEYILTTGANWAGPIGHFRMTLDKGSPDAILTLCWDDLEKTAPTTFVFEATNYVPDRDLSMAVVMPVE